MSPKLPSPPSLPPRASVAGDPSRGDGERGSVGALLRPADSPALRAELLAALPDLVLVVDASSRVVAVAGHPATHLGWSAAEVVGTKVFDRFVTRTDQPFDPATVRAILSGPGPHGPITVHTFGRDGTVHELELRLTNLIDDPAVGGFVVVARELGGPAAASRAVDGDPRRSDDRLAEDLLTETAHLLESVARGAPLEHTLDDITSLVEERLPGATRCVVGVRDASGRLRHHGGRVEAAVLEALDLFGPAARPEGATCTAALSDVLVDAPEGAALVDELGLRTCWINAAVGGRVGLVVGSVVVLHADQRDPTLAELGLLERYCNVVAIAVERAEPSDRLEYRANHDELTGLPNRRELLARIADRARRRPDEPIALLFADLDRFKLINDSLGHAAGDLLLREVGERFRRALPGADTVGRLGGDEFVVLCEEPCTEEEGLALGARLRNALAEPYSVANAVVVVTTSVGLTVTGVGTDPERTLSDADLAMYAAKQRGRNRVAVFHGTMRAKAQERLGIEGALREALVNEELETWYQPQVSLATGRVVGLEALVRWVRPGHGTIEPGSFIPVAEDSGLIVPLGRWVLNASLTDARRWHRDGLDVVVTVNLSARELADPHLVDHVADALERNDVPPRCLCLEVTESDLVADADGSAATLLRLKELGVRLAIDDFGTGYATLDYVRRFAMADVLKIDRSFVESLDTDGSKDRAIVSAVIVLGQALGFSVVAEGVETSAQLDVLNELGCDAAQGWWFARPVPAPRVRETVRLVESLTAVLPTPRTPPASGAG